MEEYRKRNQQGQGERRGGGFAFKKGANFYIKRITGIAKDVRARVKQHSEGRGATYTRTRLPVKLLYQQESLTHSEALIREAQIKAMPRSKKEEIILFFSRGPEVVIRDVGSE